MAKKVEAGDTKGKGKSQGGDADKEPRLDEANGSNKSDTETDATDNRNFVAALLEGLRRVWYSHGLPDRELADIEARAKGLVPTLPPPPPPPKLDESIPGLSCPHCGAMEHHHGPAARLLERLPAPDAEGGKVEYIRARCRACGASFTDKSFLPKGVVRFRGATCCPACGVRMLMDRETPASVEVSATPGEWEGRKFIDHKMRCRWQGCGHEYVAREYVREEQGPLLDGGKPKRVL